MSHFKLNITTIPNYNDGSFYLYKIKQDNSVFPYERIELLDSNPFYYQELSLSDDVIFENENRKRKIKYKIRISQDRSITSENVLKINDKYYQVFNIYHFKNSEGYLQSDITLQEYPSPQSPPYLYSSLIILGTIVAF